MSVLDKYRQQQYEWFKQHNKGGSMPEDGFIDGKFNIHNWNSGDLNLIRDYLDEIESVKCFESNFEAIIAKKKTTPWNKCSLDEHIEYFQLID